MLRVVLTFDDGFLEHHYVAKVLWGRGMRATFFMPTHEGRWDTLARFPRLLERLVEVKHGVGSHGMYHVDLTELPLCELELHLRESARHIADVAGDEAIGLETPTAPTTRG